MDPALGTGGKLAGDSTPGHQERAAHHHRAPTPGHPAAAPAPVHAGRRSQGAGLHPATSTGNWGPHRMTLVRGQSVQLWAGVHWGSNLLLRTQPPRWGARHPHTLFGGSSLSIPLHTMFLVTSEGMGTAFSVSSCSPRPLADGHICRSVHITSRGDLSRHKCLPVSPRPPLGFKKHLEMSRSRALCTHAGAGVPDVWCPLNVVAGRARMSPHLLH